MLDEGKRRRMKRESWISTRTLTEVKQALIREAEKQCRTESEMLHLMLCRHFRIDPITGKAAKDASR